MGRGINNLLKFLDSSPSPQPSPIKGEGVFLTFYEFIKYAGIKKSCSSASITCTINRIFFSLPIECKKIIDEISGPVKNSLF